MLKNMSTKKNTKDKTMSNLDISAFCGQMAMILNAGMTTVEGLEIMEEETTGKLGKEILGELKSKLEEGYTFSESLKTAGNFPEYMIHMVEIGEKSGRVDTVFAALSKYYKKEDSVQNAVRQAVFYPAIMTIMMIVVVGFLIVEVLPIFSSVFDQLGSEITGFGKTVMVIGTALGNYSLWIFGGIVTILVIILIFLNTSGGKKAFKKFKENSRFTKNISDKIARARFSNGMSLMLASGLDTTDSLETIKNLVENKPMEEKIKKCSEEMTEGKSFEKAVVDNGIYNGLYARMLLVGFKTGSVDGVMEEIAERYEEEVDQKLVNIISVIEPSLVAILSIVVGAILLSVMFPLMGIMSSLG